MGMLIKNKKFILIICLFLLFLGLKLGHLRADPPVKLSWSGGFFGDEGAHAHNARNKIIFGKWITDDWNPMFYNPFLTLSEYIFFLICGVGLLQMRLVIVGITFLGLVFLYLTLKKENFLVALGATLLLGINYIYLMYTRLGLTDSFLSAAFLFSFFFWQRGIERKKILFLAGFICFLTYVSKGTAVYFIAVTIISLIFSLLQKREGKLVEALAPSLSYFFSGFMLAIILWLVLFYMPNHSYFSAYGDTWLRKAVPGNLTRVWQNLGQLKIFYLSKTPLVLLTPLFYLPFFLRSLYKNWKKIYPTEFFACLWWAGGMAFFSVLNYCPLRYFISVIPAFCLVSSFSLVRIFRGEVSLKGKPGVLFWFFLPFGSFLSLKWLVYFSRKKNYSYFFPFSPFLLF